ncbi:hypothetical protein VA596_41425 [Amycolatopsis sp., V23-08]|uniref:Uncharacterized protein n=1 Tax=Amycolatopsis heterodermiae TaxID=3110235 RepID=A0ABU5RIP3_9PSEU|nr:hypothetical protein [Amycolatopsis sp., V23-08]MEA5366048.1 hypothetical protein [Amycolatopsis sp., V23-08]
MTVSEVKKLRAQVVLAAKIMERNQAAWTARAEEAEKRSRQSGDGDLQDARYRRGWACGYEMALDALWQATGGEFGVQYVHHDIVEAEIVDEEPSTAVAS